MEIVKTHTGKIFVDRDRGLEFLTVGDYGRENNIKADFLGFHKEIRGVQHRPVDLSEKWVATISSQKGCPQKCKFCDCPKYGFHGNVSREEFQYQIETILKDGLNTFREESEKYGSAYSPDTGRYCVQRFNVHFARMGEPTWNPDVLSFTIDDLRPMARRVFDIGTIHPVVSTMLPKDNKHLEEFLHDWCFIKNHAYRGEAGLQFSINSTDEAQRDDQFGGKSLTLEEISKLVDSFEMPCGRKYTLNFAVTKDTKLDAKKLSSLFDRNKSIVKITPIHQTKAAVDNGFDVGTEYEDYDVYREFEDPLLEEGWDVIVFVPSAVEDSDRITCGNALISRKGK